MSIIELLVRYGTWSRPGIGGIAGARADIDENLIGRELGTVHRHFLLGNKAPMAFINRASFQGLQRSLEAVTEHSRQQCLFAP